MFSLEVSTAGVQRLKRKANSGWPDHTIAIQLKQCDQGLLCLIIQAFLAGNY